MALITCPKCGKRFSEHALACPQCGISKGEALVLIEKNAEEMRLAAEREAAERERQQQEYYAEQERLRQERLAKEAEEARIRAEKRAEWWAANKRKVGIIFAIIVGVIIALIVAVKISRSILEKKAIAEAYTLIEEGDKLVASKQFENAREMYDKAFQITENHEVRNEISKKCSDLDLAIKKEQDKYNDGLPGLFSVSPTKKVRFSKGNLQYQAITNTWRFAENQYDRVGENNEKTSSTYTGWIDLFAWGSGNRPTFMSTNEDDYICPFYEWGENVIENGGTRNHWSTMSIEEWMYLLMRRQNADKLFGFGKVNGINGLIILPDAWDKLNNITFSPSTHSGFRKSQNDDHEFINEGCDNFTHNKYDRNEWKALEDAGAVFCPSAGEYALVSEASEFCYWENCSGYWTITPDKNCYVCARHIFFDEYWLYIGSCSSRADRFAVRLVKNIADKSALILDLVGTIGTSQGTLVYDEVKNKGIYEYSLTNATVKRNIVLDRHEGDKLSLTSRDLSGKYIGKFEGILSTKDSHLSYSGTFTNYKGVSVKFKLTQR